MKAVRFHQLGGPEVMSYGEAEIPVLGPGEVPCWAMLGRIDRVENVTTVAPLISCSWRRARHILCKS